MKPLRSAMWTWPPGSRARIESRRRGEPRDDGLSTIEYAEQLIARDKANLDIAWLKEASLEDLDHLPSLPLWKPPAPRAAPALGALTVRDPGNR